MAGLSYSRINTETTTEQPQGVPLEPTLETAPRLRFTDENNEPYPKWEEKKLGDFLITADDKPATSVDIQRLLTVRLWEKGVSLSTKGQGFKEGATKFYVRRSGQLIYSKQNLYKGAIDLLSDDFDMTYSSKFNPAFNFKGIPVDKSFVLHYLLRKSYYKSLEKHASGTGSKLVGESTFLGLSITLPSLPEQEKIGEFLSALDDEVEQAERLVSLLSDRKRAYAQSVFNRTLRFHDDNGNPYPEWEEKKLGDVSEINMGQSPKNEFYKSEFVEGSLPLVQGNADISKGEIKPSRWSTRGSKTSSIGDTLISVRAPVGEITSNKYGTVYIGRGFASIKSVGSAQDFLTQMLKFLKHNKHWDKVSQGTVFSAIDSKTINRLPIPLPSLPEQEKIGSFLSALDDEIDESKRELELLKERKKAYVQRIFGV